MKGESGEYRDNKERIRELQAGVTDYSTTCRGSHDRVIWNVYSL